MKTQIEAKTLSLGALCDPISKQLEGFAPKEDLERFDKWHDAINLCYIHGLVGEAETERARKRLMKKIQETVNKS
jgi:hypothetical protein